MIKLTYLFLISTKTYTSSYRLEINIRKNRKLAEAFDIIGIFSRTVVDKIMPAMQV